MSRELQFFDPDIGAWEASAFLADDWAEVIPSDLHYRIIDSATGIVEREFVPEQYPCRKEA